MLSGAKLEWGNLLGEEKRRIKVGRFPLYERHTHSSQAKWKKKGRQDHSCKGGRWRGRFICPGFRCQFALYPSSAPTLSFASYLSLPSQTCLPARQTSGICLPQFRRGVGGGGLELMRAEVAQQVGGEKGRKGREMPERCSKLGRESWLGQRVEGGEKGLRVGEREGSRGGGGA